MKAYFYPPELIQEPPEILQDLTEKLFIRFGTTKARTEPSARQEARRDRSTNGTKNPQRQDDAHRNHSDFLVGLTPQPPILRYCTESKMEIVRLKTNKKETHDNYRQKWRGPTQTYVGKHAHAFRRNAKSKFPRHLKYISKSKGIQANLSFYRTNDLRKY